MRTMIVFMAFAATQAAFAAVDKIEVKSREPFYTSKVGAYVKISGSFIGSLDAKEPIPNLDHADSPRRRAELNIQASSRFCAPETTLRGKSRFARRCGKRRPVHHERAL